MICLSHRETKHPDLKFVSYCKGYEFSSDKNNVAHSSCLTLNTDYFRPIPRSVYHCNMTSLFYFCLLRSRDEMRLTHANFVRLQDRGFWCCLENRPFNVKSVRGNRRVCNVSNRFVFVCIWDLGRKLLARRGLDRSTFLSSRQLLVS